MVLKRKASKIQIKIKDKKSLNNPANLPQLPSPPLPQPPPALPSISSPIKTPPPNLNTSVSNLKFIQSKTFGLEFGYDLNQIERYGVEIADQIVSPVEDNYGSSSGSKCGYDSTEV
ncbi:hypothetical protein Patl1_03818 [Pistacia atlantica]|uniref:Uncharacterized protein n=1 Tax=Pistacia atlantica TaxID=434234 RepID=A0ACC1BWF7_9ROSI|nr:hypothetical protein Patl1_03818 [Pistacia atlantica]